MDHLIQQAKERHGENIIIIGITIENEKQILWYNDAEKSTHIIMEE